MTNDFCQLFWRDIPGEYERPTVFAVGMIWDKVKKYAQCHPLFIQRIHINTAAKQG